MIDAKVNRTELKILPAKLSDLIEIQTLFLETIETVCKFDYSPEQIKVWTASIKNPKRWEDKLLRQYFIIAQIENIMVGFASLESNNYLDFMYIHKNFQRR